MTTRPLLRVLIADDSALCRASIRSALAESKRVEIVGEAEDGAQAVALSEALKPDVVTMDLRMPRLNGEQAIAKIISKRHIAVVIVTDHPGDVSSIETTFGALASGAMDVLDKSFSDEDLRRRVIDLGDLVAGYEAAEHLVEPKALPDRLKAPDAQLVVVGASTGGPRALVSLFRALPADFRTPIVLVQHMDDSFFDSFAVWIGSESHRPARIARGGDAPAPGQILIAPPGLDLVMSNGTLALTAPGRGSVHTPSVDAFFLSVAQELGRKAIGVLLSGMGDDGARGLRAMRDRGALTFAQDAQSSILYGMPAAAVRRGAVVHAGPPEEIGAAIARAIPHPHAGPIRAPVGGRPAQRTVVVVDDSAIVLESLAGILEDAGYEVITVDNPLTVAQVVRRNNPDLVLIDVNMPAVPGDVVTRIMRSSTGGKVRVALHSDLGDAELKARAAACGAVGYLRKTADERAFLARVQELLK